MKKINFALSFITFLSIILLFPACQVENHAGTFGHDLKFLQKYKKTIVLKSDDEKCQVAIGGDFQGWVMASTGNEVLTIVEYTLGADTVYVNLLWEGQGFSYTVGVVNSYNDGPLDNGDILGSIYELETSTPAREMSPGSPYS